MSDYGFVYLWFDRRRRLFYVGSHWGPTDDGYVCSSQWMRVTHRRRPADFKRRILAIVRTSRADLLAEEQRWLNMIKPGEIKRRYYNVELSVKGPAWYTDEHRRLTIGQKISKALTGKKRGRYSEEHSAAIAAGKLAGAAKRRAETGFSYDAEFGERMAAAKRSRNHRHTEAHKKLMRDKMRKIRAANPIWDRSVEKKCPGCGEIFVGRESQKYCTRLCSIRTRSRHWPSHRKSTRD